MKTRREHGHIRITRRAGGISIGVILAFLILGVTAGGAAAHRLDGWRAPWEMVAGQPGFKVVGAATWGDPLASACVYDWCGEEQSVLAETTWFGKEVHRIVPGFADEEVLNMVCSSRVVLTEIRLEWWYMWQQGTNPPVQSENLLATKTFNCYVDPLWLIGGGEE